ncbi:MAG: ORF6N domain-containing protein [Opitutus sp.]|nr:ORF6N domain-containing protein [Opitutus sp.]
MSASIPSPLPPSVEIRTIRNQRVILDSDLAKLYRVPTKRFNEAVKRNIARFPADFCFPLTREEVANLRSQIATSSLVHGGLRYLPFAFTEHGAVMAANILRSPRAVQMSVFVVRAFILMREELAAHGTILRRLAEIDRTLLSHDAALRDLFQKLRPLLMPPSETPKARIGFHQGNR